MSKSKHNTNRTIVRKRDTVEVTPNEIKIIQMLSNENSREEIAEEFGKSRRTIETEIYRVRDKVGCKTVEGVIALFLRNNLIK